MEGKEEGRKERRKEGRRREGFAASTLLVTQFASTLLVLGHCLCLKHCTFLDRSLSTYYITIIMQGRGCYVSLERERDEDGRERERDTQREREQWVYMCTFVGVCLHVYVCIRS